MDEPIMLKWFETVLRPYVDTAPAGVEPVLFLDSYRFYVMASVVNVIQDMGVQVEHIPGGYTGLCQPIDVGIGKPLKDCVQNMWEDWMVEQGETVQFNPPSRQTVASWVVTIKKVGGINHTHTLKMRYNAVTMIKNKRTTYKNLKQLYIACLFCMLFSL